MTHATPHQEHPEPKYLHPVKADWRFVAQRRSRRAFGDLRGRLLKNFLKARAGFPTYLVKPAAIPAIVALVIVILGAFLAEQENNKVYQQSQRENVFNQVNLIRSRLEGNIRSNIQLVRGLVSTIAAEPNMSQQRFSQLAGHLFLSQNQLRNVAGAPGLIISLMYPLGGNESVVGLDYNEIELQRAAALRARDTGQLILAGPVDLIQGGKGLIGRFPVFLGHESNELGDEASPEFWGIVSAVLDIERIYQDSGIVADLPLEVAISGQDATGPDGALFYGPKSVLDANPVTVEIELPHGAWQIAAVPKGGWSITPNNLWGIRSFALLAAALVIAPALMSGMLIGERHEHMRELKTSERALQRVSRRLELALRTSQIGVWELDITNKKLFWDRRMHELYGVEKNKVTYEDWKNSLHPDDVESAEKDFEEALAEKRNYNSNFRIVSANGQMRTIRSMGSLETDALGNVRIVGVNWDISEDVQLNEQLRHANRQTEARNTELEVAKAHIEHNALHDSLTGLPNRRYLDEVLSGNNKIIPGHMKISGLLHIDLDRFKQINDTLGHAAGDAMLKHSARVLRTNVRSTDFVARIGGDEFVVVCTSDTDRAYLESMAARIVTKMQQPLIYKKQECRCGVSVGIASGASAPGNPQQLLVNADIALYRAKNAGRNGYQFFSKDLHQVAINTKRTADEILSGIEQNQFITHYQGQFDAQTYAITGVEALARWQHPEKGLLPPDSFIEIAEDINVMATIDRMVLEQALAQMKRWHRSGLDIPTVSVNVSARRLRDEGLIDGLNQLDIRPGMLIFELVESIFLDDGDDLAAWNIDQIKELGIDIELDDFGTGYTSVLSLMRLRPTRLKIDRQLIQPIEHSSAQRELVRSIIKIGASLGIDAVGEGVESMEQARILASLGCQSLQGFVFARPMSGRSFSRFARKNQKNIIAA